jgi:hypothetical protein
LWITVQPAASAGAIFQVDSMNGVFHGVITPTGPSGKREVMLIWPGACITVPSRASGALSAKKRKFSAPRSAALDMNLSAWPVSMHSVSAISSARASMASAMRCSSTRRSAPGIAAQAGNAAAAAFAAASISAAPPRATLARSVSSTGERTSNVPASAAASAPAIRFRTGVPAQRAR